MRQLSNRVTVLIVDRESSYLARAAAATKKAHPLFSVMTAVNGREAFEALITTAVDVVAIDLELPDFDGVGLLAEFCLLKRVPRIVANAPTRPAIRLDLHQFGGFLCLDRPHEPSDLLAAITTALSAPAGVTVQAFALLLALTQKRRRLHLELLERSADLTFDGGQLVDAECGVLQSEAAAIEALGWERPRIDLLPLSDAPRRRIATPLPEILAEAARRESEDLERRLFGPDEVTMPPCPLASTLAPMMELDGALGVSLIDRESGAVIASLGGGSPGVLDFMARHDAAFVRSKLEALSALRLDDELEEILITLPAQHHLIRTVLRPSHWFLSFQLDRAGSNLALARQRLDLVAQDLGR